MKVNVKTQFIVLAILLLLSIVFLVPTVTNAPSWWKGVLPDKKINLGLDLRGGMYLALEVENEQAVISTLEKRVEFLKQKVKNLSYKHISNLKLEVTTDAADADSLKAAISDMNVKVVNTVTEGGKFGFILTLSEKEIKRIKDMAVNQSLETIRNRIDQFGVSEPSIQRQGENRIVVQLPGIKNPQRAIDLIGKTARLEFKLVDDKNASKLKINKLVADAVKINPKAKDDVKILNSLLEGKIPSDDEVLYEKKVDKDTGYISRTPLLVKKIAVLTGEVVTDARVRQDYQFNEPYVSLQFDSEGADLFAQITGDHVNQRLAIVLDNTIYSAPVIRERIPGGRAQITGNFSLEEARDLAIILRAGALPAPVKILQKWTVGPSLGQDSINQGLLSTVLGLAAVIIFMFIYYGFSGIIADIALVLNLIFIMAIMALFQATLTLPGIAGIILTIGMAVDANIIIFERVREELRAGKTPKAALDAGYNRAFLTILDANVTTLIAGLVLFQFGSGPVKGFAVTLSVGIITSMYTAILVSRAIQEYLLSKKPVSEQKISI